MVNNFGPDCLCYIGITVYVSFLQSQLDTPDNLTQHSTTAESREEKFEQHLHKCTTLITYLRSRTIQKGLDKREVRNVKNQAKKYAWDAESKWKLDCDEHNKICDEHNNINNVIILIGDIVIWIQ